MDKHVFEFLYNTEDCAKKVYIQWVETNPSNICIIPTDIYYLASWY